MPILLLPENPSTTFKVYEQEYFGKVQTFNENVLASLADILVLQKKIPSAFPWPPQIEHASPTSVFVRIYWCETQLKESDGDRVLYTPIPPTVKTYHVDGPRNPLSYIPPVAKRHETPKSIQGLYSWCWTILEFKTGILISPPE